MEVINRIIGNVLVALYQLFWFALLLSILFMFVWKQYPNAKAAMKQWIQWVKEDTCFVWRFLFVFFTVMILFRTLLNRNMWVNPVSDVIGV